MKNFIFLILAVFNFTTMHAQGNIGIGTPQPNINASVELGQVNKGLLLNRIALTSLLSPAPLSQHIEGIVVYNTATAGASPNTVVPGLYVNDGTKWVKYTPAPLGFFARSGGTQSFLGAAVLTDWVAVKNDFGGAWNGSVFTVPAGMDGWYTITAAYHTNLGAGNLYRTPTQHVQILVDGVGIVTGTASVQVTGGTVNSNAPGTGSAVATIVYYLNAGNQVSITGNHLTYTVPANVSTPMTADGQRTYISIFKH